MPTPATSLWTQDFPFYDFPHALISAAGYLWIGNQSNTGSLIRVDPLNPTGWSPVNFPNDGFHEWVSDTIYIASKNRIYCLMGRPNQVSGYVTVTEVNPITLAFTDVIFNASFNVEQGSFACDGTYLYIALRQAPIVQKYRISDWTLITSLTTGVSLQHACRYDSATGNLYVTSSDVAPGRISVIEIPVSSFTITKQTVINHDRVLTDDFAITNDFLWLGSEQTGNILKVRKSDFSVTTISTGITARNFGVYYDGIEIWTGWEGAPGVFGRINPTTNSLQTFQFSGANQSSPNEFLHIGNVMYFTHYHLNGTLTAMGVASTVPSPTPDSILVSDAITLIDRLFLLGNPTIEISILDCIAIQDQLAASTFANPTALDTIALSDQVTIDYLGLNDFSDTLAIGETFGIWNTTYFDGITLIDQIDFLTELPALVEIMLAVDDSLELFDGLGGVGDTLNQWLFGDRIFLDDSQRVILNSTADGYLRRYLNDVLR